MSQPNIRPSRYPSRGSEDQALIYAIIDEGLFCTIAFNRDGVPHQIPTGFCRIGSDLYIHASSKSGFMDAIIGQHISFSITHMDALVLAPTAFDHSFNYRSVVGFATAEEIADPEEKKQLFCQFTDKYIPGRIADIGEPTADQIKITKCVKLSLSHAGAKVRNGDVNEKMDPSMPWCGVIPVEVGYGTPEVDSQLSGKTTPDYIKQLANGLG